MDLGGNHLRIGNEGARALADGLRKNTTVTKIVAGPTAG
jgi:hypothetical protein